jgi:GntR family phosphonate transport system transcriptional regulator
MGGLDKNSGDLLFEQLAAILRADIASGKITGRVPSARHLAEQYEVSHATTERSLRTLAAEGLIRSVRGRGWFVVKR